MCLEEVTYEQVRTLLGNRHFFIEVIHSHSPLVKGEAVCMLNTIDPNVLVALHDLANCLEANLTVPLSHLDSVA